MLHRSTHSYAFKSSILPPPLAIASEAPTQRDYFRPSFPERAGGVGGGSLADGAGGEDGHRDPRRGARAAVREDAVRHRARALQAAARAGADTPAMETMRKTMR